MTELFFESAEPSFDEQPLAEFLARFPAGTYRFDGRTTEGRRLRGSAELTHALPATPVLVSPANGEQGVDPGSTTIRWEPVANPPASRIAGYQVLVLTARGRQLVYSVDLGADASSVTVPAEFMRPGTAYKYEVLAIEASGNQTLAEARFTTR